MALAIQCSGAVAKVVHRELHCEHRLYLKVAEQEGALAKPPSSQPARHLVVAFACVAGAAGRHDVLKGVAAAAGERQHAVALQWLVDYPTVRAATPRFLESDPLLVAEIVLNAIHAALASPGGPGLATSADRHDASVHAPLHSDPGFGKPVDEIWDGFTSAPLPLAAYSAASGTEGSYADLVFKCMAA